MIEIELFSHLPTIVSSYVLLTLRLLPSVQLATTLSKTFMQHDAADSQLQPSPQAQCRCVSHTLPNTATDSLTGDVVLLNPSSGPPSQLQGFFQRI